MSINLPMNFDYNANEPLDVRFLVNILNEANTELPLDVRYPGMIAYMRDMNGLYWLDGDMVTWHRLGDNSLDYDTINDKLMDILMKHDCCDVTIPENDEYYPVTYNFKLVPKVLILDAPKYVKAGETLTVSLSYKGPGAYGLTGIGTITVGDTVYRADKFYKRPSYYFPQYVIENVNEPIIFNVEYYGHGSVTYKLDDGVTLDNKPSAIYSNREYIINATIPDDMVIDMDNSYVTVEDTDINNTYITTTLENAIDSVNNTITIPIGTLGAPITIKIALKNIEYVTCTWNVPKGIEPVILDGSGKEMNSSKLLTNTTYKIRVVPYTGIDNFTFNGYSIEGAVNNSYITNADSYEFTFTTGTDNVVFNLNGVCKVPVIYDVPDVITIANRVEYIEPLDSYTTLYSIEEGYELDVNNSYVTIGDNVVSNAINISGKYVRVRSVQGYPITVKLALLPVTNITIVWNLPENVIVTSNNGANTPNSVYEFTLGSTVDGKEVVVTNYTVTNVASYEQDADDSSLFRFTTLNKPIVTVTVEGYLANSIPITYDIDSNVTLDKMPNTIAMNTSYTNNITLTSNDVSISIDSSYITMNGIVVDDAIDTVNKTIMISDVTGPIVIRIVTAHRDPFYVYATKELSGSNTYVPKLEKSFVLTSDNELVDKVGSDLVGKTIYKYRQEYNANDELYRVIAHVRFSSSDVKNLIHIDNLNIYSDMTNLDYLLERLSGMRCVLFGSTFDISNITTMIAMFYNCTSLTTLDVSNWDVSNVSSMTRMFEICTSLTTLDVSKWDVSSVTDMNYMFNSCTSLTTLDVSKWDVSSVTDMSYMFRICTSLTTLDVSKWDVSSVTDMTEMFSNCKSLTALDVSNWNVSSVTNMRYMFDNCESLTTLDVSKWDVSSVTDMYWMFRYCSSLTALDVSNWNVSSVTNMRRMFYNCSSLTTLDLSKWDVSSVTDMNEMFVFCTSLTTLDLSELDVSSVTNMESMFQYCSSLTTLDLSGWNLNNSVNTEYMFIGCNALTKAGVIMSRCDNNTRTIIDIALNKAGIS